MQWLPIVLIYQIIQLSFNPTRRALLSHIYLARLAYEVSINLWLSNDSGSCLYRVRKPLTFISFLVMSFQACKAQKCSLWNFDVAWEILPFLVVPRMSRGPHAGCLCDLGGPWTWTWPHGCICHEETAVVDCGHCLNVDVFGINTYTRTSTVALLRLI